MLRPEILNQIREHLELTDREYNDLLEHSEDVIKALRETKEGYSKSGNVRDALVAESKDIKNKGKLKSKDKQLLLKFNIHIHFMDGGGELDPKEIAEKTGYTNALVNQVHRDSIRKLKQSKLFQKDGDFGNWYSEDDQIWL